MAKAKQQNKNVPAQIEPSKDELAQVTLTTIREKVERLKHDGAIVCRNAMDAALGSEIINQDIPQFESQIEQLWGEDKRKARELYDSLNKKVNFFLAPMREYGQAIRKTIAVWKFQEQQKRDAAAAQQQKKLDKQGIAAVVQSQKVEVPNVTVAMRKCCAVVAPMKLIELVAQNKAPREFISFVEGAILKEARRLFDSTPKNKDGVGKIYDGTIEIWEEPEGRKDSRHG